MIFSLDIAAKTSKILCHKVNAKKDFHYCLTSNNKWEFENYAEITSKLQKFEKNIVNARSL
jgi:hypothetical protein